MYVSCLSVCTHISCRRRRRWRVLLHVCRLLQFSVAITLSSATNVQTLYWVSVVPTKLNNFRVHSVVLACVSLSDWVKFCPDFILYRFCQFFHTVHSLTKLYNQVIQQCRQVDHFRVTETDRQTCQQVARYVELLMLMCSRTDLSQALSWSTGWANKSKPLLIYH